LVQGQQGRGPTVGFDSSRAPTRQLSQVLSLFSRQQ